MKLNRMSQHGKKVLTIAAMIRVLIIICCFAAVLIINQLWLHWIPERYQVLSIVIVIILIVIEIIWDCILRPWLLNKQHGYLVNDQVAIVQEGMWFVDLMHIPLFRIQNVDIEEGWLMRKWQLANLTLSTAGGNCEIILIDKQLALKIMHQIKQSSHNIDENIEETGE